MLKHYAEMIYAGFFVEETKGSIEISNRDIKEVVIPDKAVGVRLYDRNVKVVDGQELLSEPVNIENYFKGKKYTLEQVQEQMPDKRVLIINMKYNKHDVVMLENGMFYPLYENDHVL